MDSKPSIEEYLNFIGATIPVVGSGWRKMKCPFHPDAHASAAVNYDHNAFICHGCGVKGDTFSLIMFKEGGSYREAVKFAATILASGNPEIRGKDRVSIRVSGKSQSLGRRGKHISSRSSRRPSSRA